MTTPISEHSVISFVALVGAFGALIFGFTLFVIPLTVVSIIASILAKKAKINHMVNQVVELLDSSKDFEERMIEVEVLGYREVFLTEDVGKYILVVKSVDDIDVGILVVDMKKIIEVEELLGTRRVFRIRGAEVIN